MIYTGLRPIEGISWRGARNTVRNVSARTAREGERGRTWADTVRKNE